MRVLFTTPILEHPAAGGPQLRIENSLLALNRVSELYVVARIEQQKLGGKDAECYFRRHCREFVYAPSVKGLSVNRFVSRFQRLYKKYVLTNDADFILDYVDQHKIDVIWFGYGNVSHDLLKSIKTKRPDIKVICDTDSVWSRFILRELPYESNPDRRKQIENKGKKKEQEEREWVDLCEVTTAVSEVDADYYRNLTMDREKIKIFSNAINLDTYSLTVPPPGNFKKPCIYLAGTFWPDSPMEKAARWVIDKVLPLVRNEIPHIHFYIVGSGSRETLRDIQCPEITIYGKVPTVLPYLCNADVSIVPLTFESGTRFKILESAACNIPIVSTTLGAEGIPVTDGENIVIADDPDSFARGIIKIIQDKAFSSLLATNCRQLVQASYSVTTLANEAEEILLYIAQLQKNPRL